MAINRWVASKWSSGSSDDYEDERVKFLIDTPDTFRSHLDYSSKTVRSTTSRNKLIDLLGAEYLLLLNDLEDEVKQSKMSHNGPRKTRVAPKLDKPRRGDLIKEESDDDVFDSAEDLNNFRRYTGRRHIGTGNWGEDCVKNKRRDSAPILTIPQR